MRCALFVNTALIGALTFAAAAFGDDTGASADKIGKKIDLALKNPEGKPIAADELRDKKAIVLVFLSFECPVSNSYCPLLTALANEYADRDAKLFAVVTNPDDSAEQIAKYVTEYRLSFPIVKDHGFALVDSLKATTTPEVFVLDRHRILRYRGRIDDGYAARLKRNQTVTRHDLRQAIEEVLAEKPVSEPVTKPIGCAIVRETPNKGTSGAVTYYRDVVPILQSHCQQCHRPGEVGPFSLMTYRHAVNWANDIKDYTQKRLMPPWKPSDGPGFQNDRRLSDKEIATLAAWVDGGTPEGDKQDAPPPRQFPKGWQLGEPDLVLTVSDDFQLGPSGRDLFRCFVLPTDLPEDKFVVAVDLRPGNPRIVHHVLLFTDTSGKGRQLEQRERDREKKPGETDIGPGYSSAMGVGFAPRGGLGGWAPGQMPRYLPEGYGLSLPKGADVVAQVHYHRDGRTEIDRTKVGLYFAKKSDLKPMQQIVARGGRGRAGFFVIPAGAPRHRVAGSLWVEQDCTIHNVLPHMHLLGKSIKITMTPPKGPTQTLVAIDDWDYNWQETYVFKEPIPVKADTRFDIEAFYDNSAANPNNPNNPPKLVTFGEQTTNEMLFGFIGATSDKPGRLRVRFEEKPKEATKSSE
jgi:thiol-disulfide isomerase/thioredoxin